MTTVDVPRVATLHGSLGIADTRYEPYLASQFVANLLNSTSTSDLFGLIPIEASSLTGAKPVITGISRYKLLLSTLVLTDIFKEYCRECSLIKDCWKMWEPCSAQPGGSLFGSSLQA